MIHSKREIPHYYVDMDVDMTDLIGMREAPEAPEELASASITAFVLRATAMALLEFPTVNASWHESGPVQHGTVNLGVAVALADEWIVVPVIHGADGKSVSEISNAVVSMARKARAGTLTPDEVSGASFTVSNLGMYGVDTFHAIINPPESGILAVGAVVRRPAAVGSEIVLRMIARLSLSADHRVYSGGAAARFLSSIRQALEHPAGALVSTPDASLGEGNDL